jgi:hypothetical protein
MLWGIGVPIHEITAPKETMWVSQGKNPVALMRTSWTDPSAIYLAAKGGSVSVNHAHMDIGSFIMEADGEKWAMDFGMQQYESLESKGFNYSAERRMHSAGQYSGILTLFIIHSP